MWEKVRSALSKLGRSEAVSDFYGLGRAYFSAPTAVPLFASLMRKGEAGEREGGW